MKRLGLLAVAWTLGIGGAISQSSYVPPKGEEWARIDAESAGFDAKKLEAAVEFAKANESSHPRDFSNQVATFGRLLGPIPAMRGGTKGLILKSGKIVAEWGETNAVEPTYSAAKSFLSTLLGIAVDGKKVKSVEDPVRDYVKDGGYESERNAKVTWAQHVWQTTEWEGAVWGKNHDFQGREEFGSGRRNPRELREPGSFYEYNDVRINRLALSLLRVFDRPLPDVLKSEVMDKIGATSDWRYHGYENSKVDIGGQMVASVTGGTRWGGGLWIGARDQARFGLLFLRKGLWGSDRVISEEWVKRATTPSPVKDDYGMLWWLNPGRRPWPSLSDKAFAAIGFGSNTIWIDPERDLVVVWRWHAGNGNELLKRIVEAEKPGAKRGK